MAERPSDDDTLLWRGGADRGLHHFEEALADFTAAIRINPKSTHALEGRAFEYSRRGDYQAAINDLTTALELEPESSHLHERLGRALLKARQFGQAIQEFSTVLQTSPENSNILWLRKRVKRNRGIRASTAGFN